MRDGGSVDTPSRTCCASGSGYTSSSAASVGDFVVFKESLSVGCCVAESVAIREALGVLRLGVTSSESDAESEYDREAVGGGDTVTVPEICSELVTVGVGGGVMVTEIVCVGGSVIVAETVTANVSDSEAVACDSVRVGDTVRLPDTVADSVTVVVMVSAGV